MMRTSCASFPCFCLLFCLDCSGLGAAPSLASPPSFATSSTLSAKGSLSFGLALELPGAEILSRVEAEGEELSFKGGFESEALSLGPARSCGPAAFIASPAGLGSCLRFDATPFRMATDLPERPSVLALRGSLGWGAERADLAGFCLADLDGSSLASAGGFEPASMATGLVLSMPCAEGGVALMAGLAAQAPSPEADSWHLASPEPPSGHRFFAAAFREARGRYGRAALALGLAVGEHESAARAFRLESDLRVGMLSLACRIGASGAGFRDLEGEPPSRNFVADATGRLALRSGASVGLGLRAQREDSGPSSERYSLTGFARKASLDFYLPGCGGAALAFRPSFAFGVDADGLPLFELGLGFSGKAGASPCSASLTLDPLDASSSGGTHLSLALRVETPDASALRFGASLGLASGLPLPSLSDAAFEAPQMSQRLYAALRLGTGSELRFEFRREASPLACLLPAQAVRPYAFSLRFSRSGRFS
jgi:hypothetical protein